MAGRRMMLTEKDREEISRGLAAGEQQKQIAARIGRDPSVVYREVARHGGRADYRAGAAGRAAARSRCRPKARKLDADPLLRQEVTALLKAGASARNIAGEGRSYVECYGDGTAPRRPGPRLALAGIIHAGVPVVARVVVFLDWQNVYNSAREAFYAWQDPHWQGQVDPVALARHLAQDSPFDRELRQVRIYRGQPDGKLDPRGYSASRRQHATWQKSSLVTLVTRPLRYPKGWPARHRPGERPQEKGIDVALALDFVLMGIRREYDAGILMSGDTDMKPALEAVAALTDTEGTRAEVAAWSAAGQHNRRLSIRTRNLYCHRGGKDVYDQVADPTDYSV